MIIEGPAEYNLPYKSLMWTYRPTCATKYATVADGSVFNLSMIIQFLIRLIIL
jgi:hypothetical protein